MDFSEDLVAIQGILRSAHKKYGDFTAIKHKGGNEMKINRIVEDLQNLLASKKYLLKGKINPKYEYKLREINLFFILNTDFTNKSIITNDNKFVHLMDIVPQLSKCLLAHIVWGLDLCKFYSEAIVGLPVPISAELLENANTCIRVGEPYLVLEHVAMIILTVYLKLYHLRFEPCEEQKVNHAISKLLKLFTEILQNYITPETDNMESWPQTEMYRYMGVAIHRILRLLKCCLNIFLNNIPGDINEIYKVNTSGPSESPERLDKSAQALKKCNICLMSVCEANLQAVTVDIFCSWAEYTHNNAAIQQTIGTLAYDVRQQLEHFEGCGNLPQMLDSIMVKPKSIEDVIREADEETLLKNVVIHDSNQLIWFKALLKHGILKSTTVYETFKSLVHLCSAEDYLYLLNYSCPYIKDNPDLKNTILTNITKQNGFVNIVAEYFQKTGIDNLYETSTFDAQLNEILNKLSLGQDISPSLQEIASLSFQNPVKLLIQLLKECTKNNDQVSIIVKILKSLKPICNVKSDGNNSSFLTSMVYKFLQEHDLDRNTGKIFSGFINKVVTSHMITSNMSEGLLSAAANSLKKNKLSQCIIILKIIQSLPENVLINEANFDNADIIETIADILSRNRWNFIEFKEEKVKITTQLIYLIQKYKKNVNQDSLKGAIDKLGNNQLNLFYFTNNNAQFLSTVSQNYNKNADKNEQACRLLQLLPCCNPDEWHLVCSYLVEDNDPLEVLQLLIDVMLVLSEISKKPEYHNSLSYCFQQFCIVVKSYIYPLICKDTEAHKTFIKQVCMLVKHLPAELQNTNDLSLINLFNFDVLKSMADDKDFIYILISISHLEFCKVICSKMV